MYSSQLFDLLCIPLSYMTFFCIHLQLYDLHIGSVGESSTSTGAKVSTGDGCPSERGCDLCAANSTCIGSLRATEVAQCICHPGLRGDHCDIGRLCNHSIIFIL